MMESPDTASEMACPMVLQAVVVDVQVLLSLPLTPLTYHVLAEAAEVRATTTAAKRKLVTLFFMIFSSSSRQLRRQDVCVSRKWRDAMRIGNCNYKCEGAIGPTSVN